MKRGEKNIMKRKVIAITLTAMMAAGMLAGCGSSDSSSSSTADTTKEASATEADGRTDGDSNAAGGDFSGQISVISREDGSGTRVREGTIVAALLVGFIARTIGKKLHFLPGMLFE